MSFPERIVPDEVPAGIIAIHLKRYEFALTWCTDKDVLDAACGVGYGSEHLARAARRVVGIDIDEDSVAYARDRYGRPNVEFLHMDAGRLEFPAASFDVVCSFETIEHVEDPEQVLGEFARVLRPEGMLLISSPQAPVTTHAPMNPHHRIEFSRADFETLLGRFFADVQIYGQRRLETPLHRLARRLDVLGVRRHIAVARAGARLLGTTTTADLGRDDLVISREGVERARELIGVCRCE